MGPLNMYSSKNGGSKELPGINTNHRSSSNNRNLEEGADRQGNDLNSSYHYKKRNASGNPRNLITMNNSLNNAAYGSNMTPSKMGSKNQMPGSNIAGL